MRTASTRRLLTALLAASAVAAPRLAAAQQEGEFSVQRFEPAPGTKNYFTVEGARVDGQWGFTAGLAFNYANKPFVVVSCVSEEDCESSTNRTDTTVIEDMFAGDVLATLTPMPRLQLGLRVPMAYVNGSGIDPTTGGPASGGLSGFGLGDPTLEGKVRLWGAPTDPYVIGAALDVSAPLGHATAEGKYIGSDTPVTAGLRGIFDGHVGAVSFGLNLRGIYRKDSTLGSTTVGPEFRYGAALGYEISPIFRLIGEGYGGTRFSAKNGTNSLEALGGFQLQPLESVLIFTAGGGAGITKGVGVPAWRALAMLTYVNEIGDRDGDGLDDKADSCPTIAEDMDSWEDTDGCPEDDNDKDRILDVDDKCPNQPETINGLDDKDGCPDEIADRDKDAIADNEDKCPDVFGKVRIKEFYGCADADGDGVPDPADKCVNEAEDTDGFDDTDGCPDPDNDGDGILDEQDECIDQPETKNGLKDEDGCPDQIADKDKDGIPDDKDKCPTQPETFNGQSDEDGCPEVSPQLVKVTDTGIQILDRVEFGTASDKIQGAKSFAVLDAVAAVVKAHPEIQQLEVGGHTDNVGSAQQNTALSQKRAEAVVAYLVTKGVEKGRLQAKGYGPDKPVADNTTPAGRQKNRRVEFKILKSNNTPAGGTTVQGTPAPAAAAPAPAAPAPAAPAPAAPAAQPPKP